MKITTKQYAQALFESLADKNETQGKQIIEKFVGVLAANRDLKKADKIVAELDKMIKTSKEVTEVKVLCAVPLEADTKKEIKNYIKKVSKAKEVKITEELDKKLLGGIVLRYQDKIFDACTKTRLKQIYQQMIR